MKDYEEDKELVALMQKEHEEVLKFIRTPIGEFSEDFPVLDPLTARMSDNAYFDIQLKAMEWAAGTDIAVQAILPTTPLHLLRAHHNQRCKRFVHLCQHALQGKSNRSNDQRSIENSAKYFVYGYDPLNGATLSSDPNFRAYNLMVCRASVTK